MTLFAGVMVREGLYYGVTVIEGFHCFMEKREKGISLFYGVQVREGLHLYGVPVRDGLHLYGVTVRVGLQCFMESQ